MKKIGFLTLMIVFGVLVICTQSQAGNKTYTMVINKQGEISIYKKSFDFKVSDDFPASINLKEATNALIAENDPDYEYKAPGRIKNIFPWKLKRGNKFRLTHDNGVIQAQKIPVEAPLKIKRNFYVYLVGLILVFILASLMIPLTKLQYKKTVLLIIWISIGATISLTSTITPNIPQALIGLVVLAIIGWITGPFIGMLAEDKSISNKVEIIKSPVLVFVVVGLVAILGVVAAWGVASANNSSIDSKAILEFVLIFEILFAIILSGLYFTFKKLFKGGKET